MLFYADVNAVYLESSSPSSVRDQTKDGIVASIRTTGDVSTPIRHIPRATHQSSGGAKNTLAPTIAPAPHIEGNNSTKNGTLDATGKKTNSTGSTLDSVTEKAVVTHIPRSKRNVLYDVMIPFNFFTLHQPCDYDLPHITNHRQTHHCQWVMNLRYLSESYYRVWMLFRAEAFFFGQYAERLRRYEIDPHSYAYPNDNE